MPIAGRGQGDRGATGAPESPSRSPIKPVSSSPGLHCARASIMSHETRSEDKRFTVYKIDISIGGLRDFSVFHRYSEFRELYDALRESHAKELGPVRFPGKRFVGNFDPQVIQQRQRLLQDFTQLLLSDPVLAEDARVRRFLMDTPRHGRGHIRHQSDDVAQIVIEEGKMEAREGGEAKEGEEFDLGGAENKKASVQDFTMLKVIGKGSFGKVLVARHNASRKLYAIKVLSKDAIVRQNEVKHIMSERNVLLGNVAHPFLVGLHFSFQTPAKLYFVLDYASGGELFFHLQREKRFSIPRALFYTAEIASAVAYLHSLNIVYRDLKPENILFDATGHIVLTDFGLCKEDLQADARTTTFCGTPEYLAPEVLQRQPYGRAVDWWCLGCVSYEMMCGLPPFYSRHVDEMYRRILHDLLRVPDHVPPVVSDFLAGLLIKDPARRLGVGGAGDVITHAVFQGLDFAALERREIPPPWLPSVSDELDLRHFDPGFVGETVPRSVCEGKDEGRLHVVGVREVDPFAGFSFMGEGVLQ